MSEELLPVTQGDRPFQQRVDDWLIACFGAEIARDRTERNHRFLEEALELVQACGCTASEAHQLVDYTFGRPVGERGQEVGGVMNTLAALCLAYGLDMSEEGDREMVRCWEKIDRIREKQRDKPKHSPLPESTRLSPPLGMVGEIAAAISHEFPSATEERCRALAERLAALSSREDVIAPVREQLRTEMLAVATTGLRANYQDGYAMGLARAIDAIDSSGDRG